MENQNQLTTQNPQSLIEVAIKNKASIEQLEKLMALQERWEKKEARKMFYNALAKFQSEKPELKKDGITDIKTKSGAIIKYGWAKLPTIQKQIDPILSKHGLSYRYETIEESNKITIVCVLTHEAGHEERTKLTAGSDTSGSKNSIQALGSTNSYLQRYTLCNALALSADEDNDGNSSNSNGIEPKPKVLTEKQIKVITGKISACKNREELTKLWNSTEGIKTNNQLKKLVTEKNITLLNKEDDTTN